MGNHPINFPSSALAAEMHAKYYPEKSFDTSNRTYDTGATTVAVMNCPSSPDRSTSTATTASLRTTSPSHGESTDFRSIDNFSNNAFVQEKKRQQVRLNEISIPRNWSWSEPTEITSNAHYERSIRHSYSDLKSFEEELSYLSVSEGYRC